MSERLKSMKRILAVQAHVKKMAEAKLNGIEQRKAQLEADRNEIADYITRTGVLGDLAAHAIRHGGRLQSREVLTERERDLQAKVTMQAQSRMKLVENKVDELARDHRAAQERKDLSALIEAFVARTAAGE